MCNTQKQEIELMDPFSIALNKLLVSTYRQINRIEEIVLRNLSKGNLSITELHILDVIGRNGCTVTDISQSMGISMPSATIAVKKLEKKGYVTKEKDSDDARRVCVQLTMLGRRADAAHYWFHRHMIKSVENEFAPEERELLLKALNGLNKFFAEKGAGLEKTFSPEALEASREKMLSGGEESEEAQQ
jgi:DNA-binding MarR family transcriptional regulator